MSFSSLNSIVHDFICGSGLLWNKNIIRNILTAGYFKGVQTRAPYDICSSVHTKNEFFLFPENKNSSAFVLKKLQK